MGGNSSELFPHHAEPGDTFAPTLGLPMANPLASLKYKMQTRTDFLEKLNAVLAADPALGEMIFVALAQVYGNGKHDPEVPASALKRARPASGPGRPRESTSRVSAVTDALRAKPWMGTPELRRATGLTKSQMVAVLRDYAEQFESKTDPHNAKRHLWRVKESS
jgi:hypothetical protein